jgi:NADPH-dependent 2,4-dienoyl-CoA reductase/sulfur reductase-like enzyme
MKHRKFLLLAGLTICNLCTVTHADDLHYYRQVESGKPKQIECDVVAYGGTPAGVTTAIQAARMGKKGRVAFLQPARGRINLGWPDGF